MKSEIARKGGLVDLDWDGALKRAFAKKEWREQQQLAYSKKFAASPARKIQPQNNSAGASPTAGKFEPNEPSDVYEDAQDDANADDDDAETTSRENAKNIKNTKNTKNAKNVLSPKNVKEAKSVLKRTPAEKDDT